MTWLLWIWLGLEGLAALVLGVITALTVRMPIFWLIQFLGVNLAVPGWFICLSPPLAKLTWLWWNDDDPPTDKSWWAAYVWLAWRNPVDNFKHVKWTQRQGGPLAYKTWVWNGSEFYYKAGWMSDSYCALSAGGGKGF
jgi:hypothetical protein